MFSPALHSLMIHAHIDDLHRSGRTYNRSRAAAEMSETCRTKAAPLTAYIKRAIPRISVRYA